ncbi:MAG TPA: DUF1684 domain-containing protein [Acidobacteriota bacterium]|nr:DUF1684 domain-containing protein [Acidobacteriota bacterium]
MNRVLVYCALLVLTLTGCSRSRTTGPVKLDKTTADAIIKEIDKDRAETREWLRSNPISYLAAVDRIDFGEKSALTVGKADDNNVRLSDADIEPHHLRIAVDGDRFRVEAIDAKAGFKVKDELKREAVLNPTSIQVGRFHLRLSHQRYPAIIVFDPQSPRMKEYKGIEYFPVDLSYRYELPLARNPNAEKIIILSTRGNRRSAERVGWLDFVVDKTPCRLEATRLLEPGSGEEDLSVFFTDATSGKETYKLGRYVDLKKLPNGNYLLDFNTAYNPACAFSIYYNCPVPPKANALAVAIRAGEKDSHYH